MKAIFVILVVAFTATAAWSSLKKGDDARQIHLSRIAEAEAAMK